MFLSKEENLGICYVFLQANMHTYTSVLVIFFQHTVLPHTCATAILRAFSMPSFFFLALLYIFLKVSFFIIIISGFYFLFKQYFICSLASLLLCGIFYFTSVSFLYDCIICSLLLLLLHELLLYHFSWSKIMITNNKREKVAKVAASAAT